MSTGSQTRVRLGMVGLGGATMQLLPSIVTDERVEIAGVVDADERARRDFADDFAVPAHESVEALAADPGVDAVYLATPHALHADQAVAALAQGTHVLVEKPLSLTVADCLRVVEASRASGAHVVVGHTHAFDRPVRALRDLLDHGDLGEVAMITSFNYGSFLYRPRRPEELDTRLGGGIMFNQVPHQVDLVRLLGGGLVRSVRSSAFVLDPSRPTEGSHTTFLDFEGGAVASLVYSGYDRFDTDELTGWIDENGAPRRPDHGSATRALRALPSPADEPALKAARGYQRGWAPPVADGHQHPHFGLLLVSCERADVRVGPSGLQVYDIDGMREVPVEPVAAVPDKSAVLDDLYRAVVLDEPSPHDAAWGAATVEVCEAILASSHERREVTLAHQVPRRRPAVAVSPDPAPRDPAARGA